MNSATRRTFLQTAASALAAAPFVAAPLTGASSKKTALAPGMHSLMVRLRGVHNFLTTPFLPDYGLDADGLRNNAAHYARAGTPDTTLVVGGGLGELFALNGGEQRAMAEAAAAGSQGRMPVVVGAGGGYRLALDMARNAEQAGADALLLFSPPYGASDAEGAYQYFKQVAASVGIGVILYPRGKESHWASTIRRLAEIPNIIGFKDASGDIKIGQSLAPLVPDRFLWIAESETHAAKAMPAGARAYTTAVAVFTPNACREFWQHGIAGRVDQMNAVRKQKLDPVLKLRGVKPGYGISGIKVGLEALGLAGGPVRPPGTQVLAADRAKIAEIALRRSEAAIR